MILENRTIVVTGGGTGIGAAIARAVAAEGAHPVVAGRRPEPIEAVAAETGGTAHPCDVTDGAQVAALFATARARTGRIDGVVVNAGGPGPIAPVAEVEMDAWAASLRPNLIGAMHTLQHAARAMVPQGAGSIVTMSSLMGIKGQPMRSAYCAAKFALVGITEAMAREVGPAGVRVNALLPGAVSGGNMDRILARRAEAEGRPVAEIVARDYTDVAALRRWVSPEEVAAAAVWLLSDASAATTGDRIKVDAGRF